MKAFAIFRTGRHTASSGAALDFSAEQLKAAVAAYDPALHEAPIVVGHPETNHPAYGWVKGLSFDEGSGEVFVDPHQVDPSFDEMVGAGRFKKRSASWYLPDSPTNPKPGTLYLRHVGFLGAQPPAVKGLKDVAFHDGEKGVAEFTDSRWAWGSVASLFRGLREWMISDKGLETADKLIPNYLLSDVEAASKQPDDDPVTAGAPAYSEGNPDMDAKATARLAELEALHVTQAAEIERLKANQKPADFAERETALQARETAVAATELALARATTETRVDAIIKAGRLLPAQKKSVVDFAMGLAAKDATLDFGEGDKAKKVTQREAYLLQLEAAPKIVNYGELAPGGGEAPGADTPDVTKLADRAREIHDKAEKEGKAMSFTEATALAHRELTAAA